MGMLEELKEKEAALAGQVEAARDHYQRLATELAMVRCGIERLTPRPPGTRGSKGKLPDHLLDQAEAMRAVGVRWQEISLKLDPTAAALQKAVERRQKGNPHLRRGDPGRPN